MAHSSKGARGVQARERAPAAARDLRHPALRRPARRARPARARAPAAARGLVDFSAGAVVPDARAGGLADFGAGAVVPDARAGGLAGWRLKII